MRIELVGLIASLTVMSCPLLMPPSVPPALLLRKPSSVDGGGQHFGLACAGNRHLAAEDEGGHAGHAHFAGQRVFAHDQRRVLIAFQQAGDFHPVHAAEIGNVGQDAGVADILAILETGDEQAFHHIVLDARRFGPMHQAVGIERVGPPADGGEIERNAFLFALGGDDGVHFGDLAAVAELGLHIGIAGHAFGGDTGVQPEGPPFHIKGDMRTHGQRPCQTALADEAPGTNGVGNHINLHGKTSRQWLAHVV